MNKHKKNIKLLGLKILYFKGIINLKLNFEESNSVLGANGTGKSTLLDAFSWVLFGKNADGQSDTKFGIKTTTVSGKKIEKVEHEVEARLLIDNQETIVRRVLKEKWVKKKGELNAEFTGNKTEYFWNDAPKSKREFEEKINEILNESVFRLITNPLSFNELHWEKQREIIESIIDNVSDQEIAANNKDLIQLLEKLENKSLKEYKSELASKRKKLNDNIKSIPTRIDEVHKGKPASQDWNTFEDKLVSLSSDLDNVNAQIEDKNKANQENINQKKQISNTVFELQKKSNDLEIEITNKVKSEQIDYNSDLNKLVQLKSEKEADFKTAEEKIKIIEHRNQLLDKVLTDTKNSIEQKQLEYDKVKTSSFQIDTNSIHCPTCKRELTGDDLQKEKEKLVENFNTEKQRQLDLIITRAKQLKETEKNTINEIETSKERIAKGKLYLEEVVLKLSELEKKIEEIQNLISKGITPIDDLIKRELETNDQYISVQKEISENQNKLNGFKETDFGDLLKTKSEIDAEIDKLKQILNDKKVIQKANDRITELEAEESTLAQQIANIEKEEFTVDIFIKSKMEIIEDRVNTLFTIARFKMFEVQINGGEKETCTCSFQGVNWNDLNTASKVNVGIDIINALTNHYGITVPIFIDNRESVTNIIDTDSQIINLIVDPSKKELTLKK